MLLPEVPVTRCWVLYTKSTILHVHGPHWICLMRILEAREPLCYNSNPKLFRDVLFAYILLVMIKKFFPWSSLESCYDVSTWRNSNGVWRTITWGKDLLKIESWHGFYEGFMMRKSRVQSSCISNLEEVLWVFSRYLLASHTSWWWWSFGYLYTSASYLRHQPVWCGQNLLWSRHLIPSTN